MASSLEAHGFFGAFIDAVAHGDSLESADEAVIPRDWLSWVATALASLQLPAESKSLVGEAVARVTILLKVATSRRECSKKATEGVLTQWSDVWKLTQCISATAGVTDDHPLVSLRMICTKVAMLDIEKPIIDFVEALANSDT